MKRLFYLLVFTFIYVNLTAQTDVEFTSRDHFFSRPMKALSYYNETLLMSVSGGCHFPYTDESLRFEFMIPSGNLIASANYTNNMIGKFCINQVDAVMSTNGSVYVHLWGADCDYDLSLMIGKFDAYGEAIWTKSHENFPQTPSADAIRPAADDGLWVLTNDGLLRLNANGNTVQTIPNPTDGDIIRFDYEVATNEFVWVQKFGNNNYEMVYISSDGTEYVTGLSSSASAVYLMDDCILTRNNYELNRFDKMGNLINTLSQNLNVLEITDNAIYVSNSAGTHLIRLDDSLNILHESPWTLGKVKDIHAKSGYLQIFGSESNHIYLKSTDTDFNYTEENIDIGIADIMLDTTYIICDEQCVDSGTWWGSSRICKYTSTNLRVVVENFGTAPVAEYELNVNYDRPCDWFFCDIATFNRQRITSPILPGEKDTLYLPDFYMDSLSRFASLCMHTTRPNNKIDRNTNNDEFCRDFGGTAILISNDDVSLQLPFKVFPTPTTNVINIESNQITNWQEANIKIIAIDGRQIDVTTPQVDISALPVGVYILHCEYDGLSGSRRFVKY